MPPPSESEPNERPKTAGQSPADSDQKTMEDLCEMVRRLTRALADSDALIQALVDASRLRLAHDAQNS